MSLSRTLLNNLAKECLSLEFKNRKISWTRPFTVKEKLASTHEHVCLATVNKHQWLILLTWFNFNTSMDK